ncbi:hypothetical protein [Aeromonas hydrophila]|uniref:hypothetical protein n=1 Tax=Aeromonas hydrophila TaxID=644 RepID=UPI0011154F7B|nr:hypothetical protein [Aeromonas hydrophila]
MRMLHIYLTPLLLTLTANAEPVIHQRLVATADVVIVNNPTIRIYTSTHNKTLLGRRQKDPLVTLKIHALNGSQQSYLALSTTSQYKQPQCIYSIGKLNRSNKIHYCLSGYLNREITHIHNSRYHPAPTEKALKIHLKLANKTIPNDIYSITIDAISYFN